MGADTADLAESVRLHPLPGHGDEPALRLHPDETAELLGAGGEGPWTGQLRQRQHLRGIGLRERDRVQFAAAGRDALGGHLHQGRPQLDRQPLWRRGRSRFHQVDPGLPRDEGCEVLEARGPVVGRRRERSVFRREPQGRPRPQGQGRPAAGQGAPHRPVERMLLLHAHQPAFPVCRHARARLGSYRIPPQDDPCPSTCRRSTRPSSWAR